MNSQDLEALKALAKAATPGPWEISPWKGGVTDHDGNRIAMYRDLVWSKAAGSRFGEDIIEADAAFIAEANPAAILALIARVKEAEKLQAAIDLVSSLSPHFRAMLDEALNPVGASID